MRHALDRLFDHMAWADARAFDALRADPDAFPRARAILAHIIGAEHVWLARVEGRASPLPVWPALTLDECAAQSAAALAGWRAALARLDDGALAREVSYSNSAGRPFHTTLEDIVLHVLLHGAYHRGQVALLVRQGGGVPPVTDYIAFVRGVPTPPLRDSGAHAAWSS